MPHWHIQGPVLIEAVVDPNEPLLPPKRNETYAKNLKHALEQGTPGRREIERALQEEPSRSFMSGQKSGTPDLHQPAE